MMWCLETIIALNKAAEERARKGESELRAYQDVGINVSDPMGTDLSDPPSEWARERVA